MRKVKHFLSWVFAIVAYLGASLALYHFVVLPRGTPLPSYAMGCLQGVCLIVAMCVLNFFASRGWYQIDEAFTKPFQLFTKPRHLTEREEELARERQRILDEAKSRHAAN